jgi:hypothetical protein
VSFSSTDGVRPLPQKVVGERAYGYRYDPLTGRRRIADYEAGVVRRIFNLVIERELAPAERARSG